MEGEGAICYLYPQAYRMWEGLHISATYICYVYQQAYRMREGLHISATRISRYTE